MLYQQLSLLDTLLIETVSEPKPRLKQGQTIYIVSLDCVLEAVIGRLWLCQADETNPYYGYHIKYKDGGYDCIWDYDIGVRVFLDKSVATEKAKAVKFPKIEKENLELFDGVGFQYIRDCDGWRLEAFVAKIGENQLYVHDFMCYHFIKIFSTAKERDKTYKKIVGKITEGARRYNNETDNPNPALETLYYVSDVLYASREYAENHSVLSGKRR